MNNEKVSTRALNVDSLIYKLQNEPDRDKGLFDFRLRFVI